MSNPKPPKSFIVAAEVLDAIGRYLLTQPMGQVEGLVNAVRQSRPYVELPDVGPDAGSEKLVDGPQKQH